MVVKELSKSTPDVRESRQRRIAWALILPMTIIVLWQLAAKTGVLNENYFSSPTSIVRAFVDSIASGRLISHLLSSLYRIILGFVVGAVPGIAIGLLMGVSQRARSILEPTLNAIYPLPKIALLPLFIMIFGIGETSKWATIAIGVFFPVMINSFAGVRNIDPIYKDVAKNYGADRSQYYRTVALPGAMPFIFAGLRIGMGVALLLIVAAEFVATTSGLGYMIWNSWQAFRIEDLFIGLGVIASLGVLGNFLLRLAELWLCPWLRGKSD